MYYGSLVVDLVLLVGSLPARKGLGWFADVIKLLVLNRTVRALAAIGFTVLG
jgi:hypothetical protein